MNINMFYKVIFLLYVCFVLSGCSTVERFKWPTIGISVLARNKAHTLPYFLTCLHQLDYPKDRIYLWIYSENNEDNTAAILHDWTEEYGSMYSNVYLKAESVNRIKIPSNHWNEIRFKHVIELREKAISFARKMWADFIFMIDADVFLTDRTTLKSLVRKNMTVVAPMLLSDGLYSNFWCGMTEKYYYERTDDYMPILNRKKKGCFEVPMVHTAVLINLRESATDRLTYDPNRVRGVIPIDDIITFAISAKQNEIKLNVCNDLVYGFITIPLEDMDEPSDDFEQLLNIKMEALGRGVPLRLDSTMEKYVRLPQQWKYTFDEIFMINLERRAERRELMLLSFIELGMSVKIVRAVDGMDLNPDRLAEAGITLMAKYEDPYHMRPMKMGEIGCFLSHYNIWKEIADNEYAMSLVLEDDIHFEPYFRSKMAVLLSELRSLDWDLVYIGRKILQDIEEESVTEHTVRPLYSYWTLGYILKLSGARKLIEAKPLNSLLPVDEFLPIMFDQHPNDTWKGYFAKRNLAVLSASPLLVKPTHYTGEEGYISDTEGSKIIDSTLPNVEIVMKGNMHIFNSDETIPNYRTDL